MINSKSVNIPDKIKLEQSRCHKSSKKKDKVNIMWITKNSQKNTEIILIICITSHTYVPYYALWLINI